MSKLRVAMSDFPHSNLSFLQGLERLINLILYFSHFILADYMKPGGVVDMTESRAAIQQD